MRESVSTHLAATDWQQDPHDVNAFRGPDGELMRYVAHEADLPDQDILELTLAESAVPFAVAIKVDDFRLSEAVRLARFGHQAVTSGAVRPWLDRLLRRTRVWIGAGSGSWWELQPRRTGAKQPVAVGSAAALLDSLAGEPAPEAAARAAKMSSTLKTAGWRDTTVRSTKRFAGQRMLKTVMRRTPSGGVHRLSYVLTGDPTMPQALRWRIELPAGPQRRERWDLLIDPTGVGDSGLPIPVPKRRFDEILAALLQAIPTMSRRTEALRAVYGLVAITAVSPNDLINVDMRFKQDNSLPSLPSPPLAEATAAVCAEPDSGEAWLAAGFAAISVRIHHLAVAAFGRAAELGAGQGLPLLWRGWLTRASDPVAAAADLDRAAELGGVTGVARERQALVVRDLLGDATEALEILARGTATDPECAEVWESRGLALAKRARARESVEVLTEALKLHNTATLWYYLGYSKTLLHDPYAALDCLEKAIELDPKLASEIVNDPDLAMLETEPRFAELKAQAA